MAFPPSFLDEIRNRLTCSSVVGRKVRLVKKGREFSGLCPFHNEKSPSFFVNDDKGFFHCFGCGAHGDVIGFTMRIDNLAFPEAVERLAEEAGLEVPRSSPQEAAREERRKTLGDVVEAAAKWFEQQLWSGAGRAGLDYFRSRGLSDQTIRDFRLGYAPEGRDGLRQALRKQGFEEPLMLEAALLVKPDDGRESFDFFRGRVMFPISDRRGRVIAFGGRILGDGQPKYLNSRDTPLFDKGRNLYALDKARLGLKDGGDAIVAEGYMDVIALHAGGFRGAVAPLGTALTEGQLELVWRLAPEPIVCLDGDAAGQRAARRAAERALPLLKPGKSLRFATLPPGEDPDSLLRGGGRDRLAESLATAQPLVEVIWNATLEGRAIDTPERRAAFQADLDRLVATIADPSVQALYRDEFRDRLWRAFRRPLSGTGPGARFQGRDRQDRRRGGPPASTQPTQMSGPLPIPSPGRSLHIILATAIAFPAVLEADAELFARIEVPEPDLARLRRAILEAHDTQPSLDREQLRLHLNAAGFEGIVARLLGSSIFKGLAFVRRDDVQAANLNWQKTLLELHKRGAQEELRRAGEVTDADLTDLWSRKVEEMQRELSRTQALELEDEPPIVQSVASRDGRNAS
ncbi:MAG: DNA primase [Alphaproteobacteria bacterium]|nr:DNA primase [Alphaproteobacteria bacterium]